MEPASTDPIGLLKAALAEAQVAVRAYDTKAQIVGVGYVFALGVVGEVDVRPSDLITVDALSILVFWCVIISPILLFGYVLHPTRRSAPSLMKAIDESRDKILYIEPKSFETIADLKQAAQQADPIDEYCYELLKLSRLRELKRSRFIRGLMAAAFAFLLMFAYQFFQTQV